MPMNSTLRRLRRNNTYCVYRILCDIDFSVDRYTLLTVLSIFQHNLMLRLLLIILITGLTACSYTTENTTPNEKMNAPITTKQVGNLEKQNPVEDIKVPNKPCSQYDKDEPYTGPFCFAESIGTYIGTINVEGYATVMNQQGTSCIQECASQLGEAMNTCMENCPYDVPYVFFNLIDNNSKLLTDFLVQQKGNAYVKPNAIGLGCISSNSQLTDIVEQSSVDNPIMLTLSRPYAPQGRGASECYSHFQVLSVGA